MTVKWQTRPLVREGAPHGQDSNFQTRRNIWSRDRLTDRQSQCDFDFDKKMQLEGSRYSERDLSPETEE
jgi:hypothetical protein